MTFNIWRSGGRSLERTIEAIRMAGPDVIGLQECDAETAGVIAQSLGLSVVNDEHGHAILSRHPIVRRIGPTADPWGGLGATIDVGDRTIDLFDAHLHWTSYGPYLLQEEHPPEAVVAEEHAIRMPGLLELLRIMPSSGTRFLVGDFNAPSHLDGTEVPWPESIACYEHGLADSFRILHPDDPGITWTPLPSEEPRGVFGRIDFVYYAEAMPVSSVVLDGTNCVDPWPSDHRAVASRFELT